MTTRQRTRRSSVQQAQKAEVVAALAGHELLGEILTWDAKGPHPYHVVKQALLDSGLEDVTRERLPRHAFTRACKKLAEARVIAVVRDDKDEVVFQFTKAQTTDGDEGRELEYKRETFVCLDKTTGKISCKRPDVQQQAQEELDRCLEQWTTGDVTQVVQKLFERHADLFPIRSQGGAYFVPAHHTSFVDKVQEFLQTLGGRVNRFPVPKGTTHGDAAVAEAVSKGIEELISEHRRAVESFDLQTRSGSVEDQAKRINETRLKVEAYADYLSDKSTELSASVEEARELLTKKIAEIDERRRTAPPEEVPANQRALMVLNGVPKTMREIVTEAGLKDTCYNWMNKMVSEGKVVKEGGKYRLPSALASDEVPATDVEKE